MQKLSKFVLSRNNYRLFFLAVTLCYTVSFLTFTSTVLNFFLLIWGGALFLYDLFTKRVMFQTKRCIPLIIFMLFYAITVVVNRHMNLMENVKVFLVTGLELFVLLPNDREIEEEQMEKHMHLFNSFVIVFTFVFSLAAIIMYLFWLNGEIGDSAIGSSGGMLIGLYVGANTGAPLVTVSLAFTLINLHLDESSPSKFLILHIAIQMIYLYLSNSRAALYTFILFMVIYGVLYQKGLKRKAIGVTSAAAIYLLKDVVKTLLFWAQQGLLWVVSFLEYLYRQIVYFIKNLFSSKNLGGSAPGMEAPKEIPVPDKDITMGFLNGRAELWQCGAEIIRDHPWFGIGSRNIPDVALQYSTIEKLPGIFGGGMHNIIVQTLVSNGILGFLSLAVFIVLCVIEVIRYFIRNRLSTKAARTLILATGLLLMLFINNMAEANILFTASYMATVFWSYLGFSMFFCDKDKKKQ